MKIRFLPFVLSATAIVACSAAPASTTDGTSSSDGGSTGSTTGTTEGSNVDGGASGDGTGDPSGDGGASGAHLTVTTSTFQNIGRLGDTILVSVSGSDPAKTTSAAHLRFTNEAGVAVGTVDTDFDGVADASEATYHFGTSALGTATFNGTITIPSIFSPTSHATKVFVSLENEAGGRSKETETELSEQALAHINDACDVQTITSRCEAGYSCSGTPATCQPGSAPVLTKIGYFGGSSPKMAFLGTDADEDVGHIRVQFLDSSGSSQAVALTADGPTQSSVDIDVRGSGVGGTFTTSVQPATSFVSQVPKISVTATDTVGRDGNTLLTSLVTLPTRSPGQTCDSDGFDACGASYVCTPGIRSAANTCKAAASVRTDKCKVFTGLDPSKGLTKAYGDVAGVSVWDAPIGCVGNDATGRPEAAIPLHLATVAASLTISTAVPETSFDTAVYLIPACATTSANALGCNDDAKGYASTLALTNVPAGDYTIVVESVQARGGHFGLSVKAQ